jgi:aspartyl-tRNA synthetase
MVERTAYCGTLTLEDVGREVTVAGWVHRRRDHGGVIFLDVRDRTGWVQVVVDPAAGEAFRHADRVRAEWVVAIRGTVRARPPGMINPDIATGAVELVPSSLEVVSESRPLPFLPADADDVDELTRLRYRYLDLRRPVLQQNLMLRDRVTFAVREYLHAHGFLDIETPALARSTPEGARDFLVPSRLQPGRFYALPQSPQIFKQLLMVAGLDRYYQIVKVFRDEDLRADRQPEFTQIDVEASFLSEASILDLMEGLMRHVFRTTLDVTLPPFPRLTYRDAIRLYGSDKPDLRAGPPIRDLTDVARGLAWPVLAGAPRVAGVVARARGWSRRQADALVEDARRLGASGLVWITRTAEGFRSNAQKPLGPEGMARLAEQADLGPGDWLLVLAGEDPAVYRQAGALRLQVHEDAATSAAGYRFLWVTEFPLFEWSPEEGRFVSQHHPFTMPHPDDVERLERDPLSVRAQAYDVVLNGVELASGSLRIYDAALQARVFRVLGLSEEEIQEKFGFLVDAFRFGPPPHGGIAFGLDRLVMLMAGAKSLRDVIAFPKTTSGSDPLMNAPSPVDVRQLRELGLRVEAPPSRP